MAEEGTRIVDVSPYGKAHGGVRVLKGIDSELEVAYLEDDVKCYEIPLASLNNRSPILEAIDTLRRFSSVGGKPQGWKRGRKPKRSSP